MRGEEEKKTETKTGSCVYQYLQQHYRTAKGQKEQKKKKSQQINRQNVPYIHSGIFDYKKLKF